MRPGRLDGVLGLQLGEVAGALERGLQQVGRTRPASIAAPSRSPPAESISTTNDSMPRTAGPVTPASSAWRRASRKPRCPRRRRTRRAWPTLASPTPALGHVEHPLDAHLVGRVDDRPQVGHRVLDLAPVVEAGAADHLVRHAEAHHRLLDHAALGVGAVEHGHLAPVHGVGRRAAARAVDGDQAWPRRPRPRRGSARCGRPAPASVHRFFGLRARRCWRSPRWRRRGSSACCGSSGRARPW